jgi:hypothetical protein
MGAPFRDLLLDPGYWRPKLDASPLRLVLTPRPDFSRSGIEVTGFRLKAHDGRTVHGLLGRAGFCRKVESTHVRAVEDVEPDQLPGELDWLALEHCECDLVFAYPGERRLEERVLDLLRVSKAATTIPELLGARLELVPRGVPHPAHELVLAAQLRERGLV